MLASMRTTASSIFMKVLMMLLVVSFAVWGVGDIVRGGSNAKLVTVGDEGVSYQEYARALRNAQRALEAQNIKLPPQTLENVVLQRLVEERVVKQRLEDAGLEVNQKLLASHLRRAPAFHDLTGKFDPALFTATLQQRQVTEGIFLDELAGDIRAKTFRASLGTEEITPPIALAELVNEAGTEKRDAVLFTIPASSVKVAAPDEAALKEYYDANKGLLYLSPERRTLEFVTFSAKDVASVADKKVTEEDVADRVASDPEHYKDEKLARDELRAEASESVIDDITIAIEDALAAGESMGEAVAKAGLNAQSRVLADVTAEGGNPKDSEVVAKGFSMIEGETSSIETTADGSYYLVSVQSVTEAEPKPFESVKADVAKRAAARARNKALREKANELSAALSEKSDWQAVAKEFGVSGRPISKLQRGANGGVNPALNEAIFEREVGEVAGPLVKDDSAQIALVTATHYEQKKAAPDAKTREALAKDLREETLGNYYAIMMEEYPVRINQGMMEQIRTQEGDGA